MYQSYGETVDDLQSCIKVMADRFGIPFDKKPLQEACFWRGVLLDRNSSPSLSSTQIDTSSKSRLPMKLGISLSSQISKQPKQSYTPSYNDIRHIEVDTDISKPLYQLQDKTYKLRIEVTLEARDFVKIRRRSNNRRIGIGPKTSCLTDDFILD